MLIGKGLCGQEFGIRVYEGVIKISLLAKHKYLGCDLTKHLKSPHMQEMAVFIRMFIYQALQIE